MTRTPSACRGARFAHSRAGRRSLLISCVLSAGLGFTAHGEDFDLIVRHGRVLDGIGSPAFFADIGIRDGRIAALGRLEGAAARVISATNLLVAPGFIDVHTHAEEILELPRAENFARMGVTTLVLGNCGSSVSDVGAWFRRVEATNSAVNVATLIGHGTVRSAVMGGSFMRPPTVQELAEMKQRVAGAMEQGALGLSTGLIYLPGVFAQTDELIALAGVAAEWDGIYASHMRDEGIEIADALEELFRIAREARIPAHISHLKLSAKAAWGGAGRVLASIDQARDQGLDITQDQYVYTASSTGISQLIPQHVREGGREKFIERIRDPAARARLEQEIREKLSRGGRDSFDYAVIAHYAKNPDWNGKSIPEAAKLSRGSDTLADQIDVILEIHSNGGASGVFHGINETDLQKFLRHPNTMFASDSGIRRFGEEVPHPRGYGNNARVLARYVRELNLLRPEEAVRRMTSLPAAVFRLRDRGQIREGAWADFVIFDPKTVQDQSTFDAPHQYPTGITWVVVNGTVVIEEGRHTGARPGKVLRHSSPRHARK